MRNRKIYGLIALVALAIAGVGCSTTSRLGKNDVLYTGVKKVAYKQDSVKIDSDVQSQIFTAIDVAPNNPLYSPYYRTPFPIGLWVYNHWDPNAKGLKGWLYKKLVAQPVLISRVNPQTRVEMIDKLLQNNGYFTSKASYELNYSKNKKKASITYNVSVKKPHVIGNITYLPDNTPVNNIIDSCARANKYFQTGSRYCLDSLNAVRIEITNTLRNQGYYYFKPEYIQYLADSVTTKGQVNIEVIKSSTIPNQALVRFLSNKVYVTVQNAKERSFRTDTIPFDRCTLIKRLPVNIKDDLVPSCIRSRHGRPFRVSNMDRTQLYLSRTGIFSSIDMRVENTDSLTRDGDGLLDLYITCTVDDPIELTLEAQGTTKSNGFLGPGLSVELSNKNFRGGGERLSAKLKGSYEWQIGEGSSTKSKDADINSYEVGLEGSYTIPRLLAPNFVKRLSRYTNSTKFGFYSDFLNRPKFFKMVKTSVDVSYQWSSSRYITHQLTPFKLTYSKLLKTTEEFDSVMWENPSLALSFTNQFIPEINYTLTYNRSFGPNAYSWTTTVTEAGNVFSGLWGIFSKKHAVGDKKLFGTPFSQFVRLQTQFVWNRTLAPSTHVVGRVFLGAAHAYGNSAEVPYSYQFYVGGANSIRAFTVRSIGPGSYRSEEADAKAFYDQTGTFKFETNWEFRFPLLGYLKGAVFLDAGNVWLLQDDDSRPGGKLKIKNFFKELALGTGVGLRFDMGMLVIRADLGIGLHLPYETEKKGYYNIESFKKGYAFNLAIGYPF